jgi:hypothetical protein
MEGRREGGETPMSDEQKVHPIEELAREAEELDVEEAEKAEGGVTFQDFHFTSTVNKARPG